MMEDGWEDASLSVMDCSPNREPNPSLSGFCQNTEESKLTDTGSEINAVSYFMLLSVCGQVADSASMPQ